MVVGTVIPRQKPWREKFTVLADAEKLQGEWESERMRLGAGMRLRATTLCQDALRDAEAAWAVAKKRGYSSLFEAVLEMNHPQADSSNGAATGPKTYKQLFDEFVAYHKEHASKSQSDKVRQNAKAFGDTIGWETQISDITVRDIQAWLKVRTHGFSKKTFNNILNDVSRVFSWACEPAQAFLTANPAAAINRYGAHVLAQGSREILIIEQCSRLMHFLEEHYPEWAWAFALMLFAGVRPGYHHGEIAKLMQCANRDGIERYVSDTHLRLTAEITKDRRPRQFALPDNLRAWIKRYLPKAGEFRLGSKESYAEIRDKFEIPHDGLRHTAISAHVTKNNSFALAAIAFGNSEKVIRDHYFSLMALQDAERFYQIYPSR